MPQDNQTLMICDAQIHAARMPGLPERPNESSPAGSIGKDSLAKEMRDAGVSRVVLVPFNATQNEECLKWAVAEPGKYVSMGCYPVSAGVDVNAIKSWKKPGQPGMRLSFFREADRALLVRRELDSLWEAAQEVDLPLMMHVSGVASYAGEVAAKYPGLRITIDHMGLEPFKKYIDFSEVLDAIVPLARHPNISIKLSQLQNAVDELYPFKSLYEPLRRIIDAFGPTRCFWGTDLTLLRCAYRDTVRLFTEELAFLDEADKRLIMGQAVCSWLDWAN